MRIMHSSWLLLFLLVLVPVLFLVSEAAALNADVDGDSVADVVVGAPYSSPNGITSAGSAYVYSGRDGHLIYQFNGGAAGDNFGSSVAMAGDVNADGRGDLIVGAPAADPSGRSSAGSAYVFSGITGGVLYRFDGEVTADGFGYSVSGAGDVNGDGKSDLIIGAPNAQPSGLFFAGSAYIFSGATGSRLYKFNSGTAGQWLGYSVSAAGDVNLDGRSDVVVGGNGRRGPGDQRIAGIVNVYSGALGTILYTLSSPDGSTALYGNSVSGGLDLNCDGRSDWIVGSPGSSPGGRVSAGSAFIYSGINGSLIRRNDGQAANDGFGGSVSVVEDTDSQDCSEYIIGASGADPGGRNGAGSVYVYNGRYGGLFIRIDGGASGDYLGKSVSGAGGVPNYDNGVIIGAPSTASPKAYVYYQYGNATQWAPAFQFANGIAGSQFGNSVSGRK